MADQEVAGHQTYLQKLKAGERDGLYKLGLRTIVCILDIIGIGAAAWISATATRDVSTYYTFGFNDPGALFIFILLPTCVSIVWCLICILVLTLRRPPKPAHPGIAVGLDLILWLSFIVTGLFAVYAILTLDYWGSGGYIDDPSSYYYGGGNYNGQYVQLNNGTWVYHITNVYGSGYGYGSHYNTSRVQRDCYEFESCAEQDRLVNELWQSKQRRLGTEIVVGAVQWLCLLLHFVLFVWACVDTNRRNRADKHQDTQAIADRVIRDMEARGLLTLHDHPPARGGLEMAESSQTAHSER